MSTILTNIKERFKKFNWPFSIYNEIKFFRIDKKELWTDAVKFFDEKQPKHGNLRDYKRIMLKHRVSIKEYNTYEFWHLSEFERKKYLSEKELKCIYRKVADVNENKWIDNKLMTHLKFTKYMQRDWICPSISSFGSFYQFVSSKDCIVKPWKGSLGNGVFMIKKSENNDLHELYNNCRINNLIVEERVRSCKELEAFHPQSLNTIRVFTISNGNCCELVAAELRLGIGDSVVDNVSANGIVAPIDIITGVIVGDGRDKGGGTYVCHPDAGKVIKGFVIPYWDNVLNACKEMASFIPKKVFAGWDICVLETGEIELIEVNSGPNIMGLQTAYGYGLRPRIQSLGKELLGFDLMKLISVWSKPRMNYDDYLKYKRYLQNSDLLLKDFIDYTVKREG